MLKARVNWEIYHIIYFIYKRKLILIISINSCIVIQIFVACYYRFAKNTDFYEQIHEF